MSPCGKFVFGMYLDTLTFAAGAAAATAVGAHAPTATVQLSAVEGPVQKTETPRPEGAVPFESTHAPNVAPSVRPLKVMFTSADEAAPPSVPLTVYIAGDAGSATPDSDARVPLRRPTSSGIGLETKLLVFKSKLTSRSKVRRVRNPIPGPAGP